MGKKLLTPLSIAGLILSTTGAFASEASDLVALFGKDPGNDLAVTCYSKQYDAAHLAGHPNQNVTGMVLFADTTVDPDYGRYYDIEIGVTFRTLTKQYQVGGSCTAADDGTDTLLCSIDCDGGQFTVAIKDPKALAVKIPEGLQAWDPNSEEEPPAAAKFGSDDALFALAKTDVKDCMSLIWDDDIKAKVVASAG